MHAMTPKIPTAGDDESQDAKETEHEHVQAPLGRLTRDEVVHRRDIPDWLLRQDARDRRPHRRHCVVRISAGPEVTR